MFNKKNCRKSRGFTRAPISGAGFTRAPISGAGFTLIELMVAISIIGIIVAISVVYIGDSRRKSRDAKRIHDAQLLNDVLELYLEDNGHAPYIDNNQTDWSDLGEELSIYLGTEDLPIDPKHDDGYFYVVCSNNNTTEPIDPLEHPNDNFLAAVVLEKERNTDGDIDDTYSYLASQDCISSGGNIGVGNLDCSDNASAGKIQTKRGSVICLGYLED